MSSGEGNRFTKLTTVLLALVMITSIPVSFAAATPAASSSSGVDAATVAGAERAAESIQQAVPDSQSGAAAVHSTVKERAADGESQRVIVVMEKQWDISAVVEKHGRDGAVDVLQNRAKNSQGPVLDALATLKERGAVEDYTGLWLVNVIAVQGASPEAIERLRNAPGVKAVIPDRKVVVPSSAAVGGGSPTTRSAAAPPGNGSTIAGLSTGPASPMEKARETIPALQKQPTTRERARELVSEIGVSMPQQRSVPSIRNVTTTSAFGDGAAPMDLRFDERSTDDAAWGVARVGAPAAWAQGINGSGVTIAVIDTGVDSNHPALEDDLVDGKAFVPCSFGDCQEPWDDDNGHGTHVAGIITGDTGVGVAPGAKVMPIKALGAFGFGFMSTIIQSVQYAVMQDADVVSMSLGGPGSPLMKATMVNAAEMGSIPVTSVGNFAFSSQESPFVIDYQNLLGVPSQPGSIRKVISVGSTSKLGAVSFFSAHDTLTKDGETYTKPEIVAPGEAINSTFPGGEYATFSGTSMAAPHVSALTAMLLQVNDSLTTANVENTLEATSTDLYKPGDDVKTGAGRVDVRAVNNVMAGDRSLSVSTNVSEVGTDGNVEITVEYTDASGSGISGEEITVALADWGPDLQYANGSIVHTRTVTTNSNGVATLTIENIGQYSSETGEWTVNALAAGGMVHATTGITVADTDVSITEVDVETVSTTGDTVTLQFNVTKNGDPVDATVNASLYGPTSHAYGPLVQEADTGSDGTVQLTFEIPQDPLWGIYLGLNYDQVPGSSWGNYGVVAEITNESMGLDRHINERNVTTVQQSWTDVKFGDEREWFGLDDIFAWHGQFKAGSTIDYSLSTTRPNTDHDVVVVYFANNGTFVEQTVDTVTTDGDGDVSGSFTVPDAPHQLAALYVVPTGIDISSATLGEFDVAYFHIEQTDLTVSVDGEQSNNQGFQSGETVNVTITATDSTTTNLKDLDDIQLWAVYAANSTFRTWPEYNQVNLTADLTKVDTGTYEATWTVPENVTGGFGWVNFLAFGRDFDGSSYNLVGSWVTYGNEYDVTVQRGQDTYAPGDTVKHVVRVSDPETGEPVAGATVNVTAVTNSWSWETVTKEVTTNSRGLATFSYELDEGDENWPYNSYVFVNVTDEGESQYMWRPVQVDQDIAPELHVSTKKSTTFYKDRSGGFGFTSDVATSGQETLTFEIALDNYDVQANGVGNNNDVVDALVIDFDMSGGSLGLDLGESIYTAVELGDDGTGTFQYPVSSTDTSGPMFVLVFGENRTWIFGGQLITFHDPSGQMDVSVGDTNATAGETVSISASGLQPTGQTRTYLVRTDGPVNNGLFQPVFGSAQGVTLPDDLRAELRSGNLQALAGSDAADRLARAAMESLRSGLAKRAVASGSAAPAGGAAADSATTTTTVTTEYQLPENMANGQYSVVVLGRNDTGYGGFFFLTEAPTPHLATASLNVSGGTSGEDVEELPSAGDMLLTDGHGAPGNTTTVTLYSENVTNVTDFEANITFNPNVVQVTSVEGLDISSTTANVNNEDGWVHIAAAQAEGEDNPELANITFDITGNLGDTTTLSYVEEDTSMNNEDGQEIPLSLHPGEVRVATATIDLGDAEGTTGSNVTVTLSTDASDVASYQANITFNASAVEVVSTSGTEDFGSPISNIDNENGWVFVSNAKSEGTDSPDLATITFHIKEAANGTTPLTLVEENTEIANSSGSEIPVAVYDDGSITAQQCTRGDANGDGEVSSGDATLVLRAVVGLTDPDTLTDCADANNDGELSSGDATIILRIVVGLI